MKHKPYTVLFISPENSARSIMAEALMNRWGRDRFRAFSAGINPKGEIHPLALELIARHGLPTEALASKSWTEFRMDHDRIDFIIVLRDGSAGEECPVWPGRPLTACWNVTNPAASDDTPQALANRFRKVFQELETRIKIMACLRLDAIDRLSLKQRADARADQIETPA
jgi:arsenate reductase